MDDEKKNPIEISDENFEERLKALLEVSEDCFILSKELDQYIKNKPIKESKRESKK